LLAEWLPARSWYAGPTGSRLERVGAYRFDDPDGEVGVETILISSAGGAVLQVPLTYRGAALAGADEYLVGTMDHSVLGKRWVYDGCGDPVYLRALLHAMLTGGRQAEEMVEMDGRLVGRESSALARGSGGGDVTPANPVAESYSDGDPATVVTKGYLVTLARV